MHFSDTIKADRAGEIMGYARNTVIAYIQQKHLFAVQISGKYIIPKSALAEFLVTDFAFEIVHKSTWHMNTILGFAEKE
jgi:hypothetical protein